MLLDLLFTGSLGTREKGEGGFQNGAGKTRCGCQGGRDHQARDEGNLDKGSGSEGCSGLRARRGSGMHGTVTANPPALSC